VIATARTDFGGSQRTRGTMNDVEERSPTSSWRRLLSVVPRSLQPLGSRASGANTFDIVEMIASVEDAFGIEIPDDDVETL
jgi:hypothetical protein